jgi:GDSL-like Lipase/Acylhydrolase family
MNSDRRDTSVVLDPAAIEPFIFGMVDAIRGPELTPLRIPGWAFEQMFDDFSRAVASFSAGIRLEFESAASRIELTVTLTRHPLITGNTPSSFCLFVDGERVRTEEISATADADQVSETDTVTATVLFDISEALAPDRRSFQIWFPHDATVSIHFLRADAPITPRTAVPRPRWTHYGSSISQCIDTSDPSDAWPAAASRELDLDLVSMGLAGSCMLDPYAARAIRDAPADVITLKIGINIVGADAFAARSLLPAIHGFIDTIRDGHPDTPIVVISPVFCGIHELTPGPTVKSQDGTYTAAGTGNLTLTDIRQALDQVVADRVTHDRELFYLDGRLLLGENDSSHLYDSVHPDTDGYRTMASRFSELGRTTGNDLHDAISAARSRFARGYEGSKE